jgi:hypothetical protein
MESLRASPLEGVDVSPKTNWWHTFINWNSDSLDNIEKIADYIFSRSQRKTGLS